jgi:polyisoprenoid-binding protein YceI
MLILGSLLLASAALAAPERYAFDPVHSNVLFFASHLGFSHPMGRFTGLSGGFTFDPDDWSSAKTDATIAVDTLYLGDADWQKKMLSDEFLDAKRFPTMRFVAEKLEKTGEADGELRGELTLHGVTRPVTLKVHVNRVGTHSFSLTRVAGFSATTTIKRSEFGISHLLPAVGDEVEIRLEIQGLRTKSKD